MVGAYAGMSLPIRAILFLAASVSFRPDQTGTADREIIRIRQIAFPPIRFPVSDGLLRGGKVWRY